MYPSPSQIHIALSMLLPDMLACPMPGLALPCLAWESLRPACLTWFITDGHYRAGGEGAGDLFCLFICRGWKPNWERTLAKCSQVTIKYCFKKPQGHLCWHLDKDFIEVTGLRDRLVVPMITGEGGIYVPVKNAALLWLFRVHKCYLLGCWIKEVDSVFLLT